MEKPLENLDNRIQSIDIMRGVVMVLMVLDHTREFFHTDVLLFGATDLTKTNVPTFLVRWITHLCAPTFVLLTGVGIYLQGRRTTRPDLTKYLLSRGILFILLDPLLIGFGFNFDIQYHVLFFGVVFALGVSMLCMAVLIYLPRLWVLCIALAVVFGHNLLDSLTINQTPTLFWRFFHGGGTYDVGEHRFLLIVYPIVPWPFVMALGWVVGGLYQAPPSKRVRLLVLYGILALVCFALLRGFNLYGNPSLWVPQASRIFSFLSILNVEKYPPSLAYLLVTLGPALLLLAALDKVNLTKSHPILLFGSVPMFFYIIHLFIIHLLQGALIWIRGISVYWWIWDPSWPKPVPFVLPNLFPLWGVCLTALVVLGLLYFPCRWYRTFKKNENAPRWTAYI